MDMLLAKLKKAGEAGKDKKRQELEKLSREALVAEAGKHGIEMVETRDVGAARAELFNHLKLEIPEARGWTKLGAIYTLVVTLGTTVTSAEIRDKNQPLLLYNGN